LNPATRREVRDVYTEVILEYVDQPFRTPSIRTIRELREGRWPELSEQQLRELVRTLVKEERRRFKEESD